MRISYPIAFSLACVLTAVSVGASAESKRAPKPVVCAAYRVIEPGLAVCSDSAKPFLMRRFAEVAAPGEESGSVKVLVGWR